MGVRFGENVKLIAGNWGARGGWRKLDVVGRYGRIAIGDTEDRIEFLHALRGRMGLKGGNPERVGVIYG
jgi:hypothetical protein